MIRGDMKLRICGLLLLLTLVRSQPIIRRPTIFEQVLTSVKNIEIMVRDASISLSALLGQKKPMGAEKWSKPYVVLDLERLQSPPSFLNPVVSRRSFGLHEPIVNTGAYVNDYADQTSSEETGLYETVPHIITLRQRKPQVEISPMSAEDDSSNINTNVNRNVNLFDRVLRPKYNKHIFP